MQPQLCTKRKHRKTPEPGHIVNRKPSKPGRTRNLRLKVFADNRLYKLVVLYHDTKRDGNITWAQIYAGEIHEFGLKLGNH